MFCLDLLVPQRCAGCGRGAWPFCEACMGALRVIVPPICARCGLPTDREVRRCGSCPPGPIAVARSPFLYDGPVKDAIHRLKFSGGRSIARALADSMAAVAPDGCRVVTWVPLSRRRKAHRGYDQAQALARAMGRRLGLPVMPRLERLVDVGPQARRSGAERREALVGAFAALPGLLPGRHPADQFHDSPGAVLLVDDVLTTGATAAACATALIESGVREVRLVTAARAAGRNGGRRYTRGDGPRPGSVVARRKVLR